MLLIRDIDAAAAATGILWEGAVLERAHVRSPVNAHLVEGQGVDTGVRDRPLSPDAEVHGEFLTLEWEWHSPCLLLEEHASLADVEKHILFGTGILSCFTGCLLAFIGGRLQGYEVRRRSGTVLARNGVRVDEGTWDRLSIPPDELVFSWLPDSRSA